MNSLDLFLVQYGLAAIFIILLIKTIGIPIPIPADLIILTAAARVAQGKLNVWQAFIAIFIALVIGGFIQFLLARGPVRGLLYRFGRYIGLTSHRLDAASARVKKGGALSISIAILVPGVRGAAVVASGLADLPLRILPSWACCRKSFVPRTSLFSRISWRVAFLNHRACATIIMDSFARSGVAVNHICGVGSSSTTEKDSTTGCRGDFTRTVA